MPATGLIIYGESDTLIRLFVNLIDNAIKYTEKGTIIVKAAQTTTQVVIKISDTGIGMAPEHLPHIFERFYQADQSRNKGGAGLGLAIAKEVVQAHGGDLSVTSDLGQGSTFIVQLPMVS